MANKEQYLDRNGVSHFYLLIKSKLTTFFKTLFVLKRDGFTNELKTKLENLNDSSDIILEEEIYIIEPETFDDITMTGTISQKTLEEAAGYSGVKPIYFHCLNMFIPLITDGIFAICTGETTLFVEVDTDTLKFSIEEQNSVATKFDDEGLLKIQYLPNLGFYDDVIEGYLNPDGNLFYKYFNDATTPDDGLTYEQIIAGESGKIYLDLHTNNTYRWSGSTFVKLESSVGFSPLTNEEIDDIVKSVDESSE